MQKQLTLAISKNNWGGRRSGSGRKRVHSKGVAHRVREAMNARTPLHINFKYRTYIRNKDCLRLLKRAILNSRRKGLRVIHYSMQTNHIHIIAEADNNDILESGMRSLTVTFAQGLQKGKVQIERYHLHVLKSLKEARNAIRYVLFNKHRHEKGTSLNIDSFTSLIMLKEAREIVRVFAGKERIWIRMGKLEAVWLFESNCYLGKMALMKLKRPD